MTAVEACAEGHRRCRREERAWRWRARRQSRGGRAPSGAIALRDTNLLQLALGLTPPWTVSRADFDPEAQRLDIEIDFAPGSRFACPSCGVADCPAYDTERKTWRHLNFFQHQASTQRPRATRPLRSVRHQDGQRAMGAARQWLHPAVRGAADDHDLRHAGQGRRPDGGRTQHQAVARGSPLRRPRARAKQTPRMSPRLPSTRPPHGAAMTTSRCLSISIGRGCCLPPKAGMPNRRRVRRRSHRAWR